MTSTCHDSPADGSITTWRSSVGGDHRAVDRRRPQPGSPPAPPWWWSRRRTGWHRTRPGDNSGVIHTGLYYEPGSLKSRWCTEGRRRPARLLRRAGDPGRHERQGRGGHLTCRDPGSRRAGAPGQGQRGGGEADRPGGAGGIEPHAAGVAALHVPGAAVVDFGRGRRVLRSHRREGRGVDTHRVAGHRRPTGAGRLAAGVAQGAGARPGGGQLRRPPRRPGGGPDGGDPRPEHRALPGRVPRAAPGPRPLGEDPDLPGARPQPAVPRGPLHPVGGWAGGSGPQRGARVRPGGIPPAGCPVR